LLESAVSANLRLLQSKPCSESCRHAHVAYVCAAATKGHVAAPQKRIYLLPEHCALHSSTPSGHAFGCKTEVLLGDMVVQHLIQCGRLLHTNGAAHVTQHGLLLVQIKHVHFPEALLVLLENL
jgi:hypothetical protein